MDFYVHTRGRSMTKKVKYAGEVCRCYKRYTFTHLWNRMDARNGVDRNRH